MILIWGLDQQFVGLNPLVRPFASGAASIPIPATARGNIDFDQIRVAARTGNGLQLLTWSPTPAIATSTGVTGQIAYDSSGNYYWCYATNHWARIGPGGYSNSF
jgi:hypothetical protein